MDKWLPANSFRRRKQHQAAAGGNRLKNFVPKKKELSGYLKRYAALVSGGASGAVLNG